jgi:PLD-like domain
VLFLAFDPGNNSILDAAGKALAKNPDLFVRGALTSAQRAGNFSEALHQGAGADHDGDVEPEGTGHAADSDVTVTVVGEPGKPKRKGAKLPSAAPDFRAVPAGAVNAGDAFGAWEGELAKYGFAIIHNKIVVIDPFSDDCIVVTGSHNLGYRASHNNDENMVIIRGHRALAQAYACHVLDIYDHYAWRFLLKQHPDIFGRPLEPDDKWQERYISGPDLKSPELRFWLAAAAGGTPAAPAQPARQKPASAPTQPAQPGKKKKPGKKVAKKAVEKTAEKTAAPKKPATKKPVKKATKKPTSKKISKKIPPKKKVTKKAAKKKVAKKKTAKKKTAKKTTAKKTTAKKTSKNKKAAKKTR